MGNPASAGQAQTNRTRVAPARQRKSALLPVGPGESHAPRPPEEWITVAVPQIVSEETFAQVQAKLDTNQQLAVRNTRHEYLLRALVSCGVCRLSCTVRQIQAGYRYYQCRGRTDALRAAQGQRCTARYIPAGQLVIHPTPGKAMSASTRGSGLARARRSRSSRATIGSMASISVRQSSTIARPTGGR